MRVALLPSAYAPSVGGVEQLTQQLARDLVSGGDSVEVWTLRHPPDAPAFEIVDGILVRRFVLPLPVAQLSDLLGMPVRAANGLRQLVRAGRSFRPDVLHVQCFSANGLYAALLGALLRRPLIITLQGETVMDDHEIYDRSVVLRAGLRFGLRRADAVTACSDFVLRDARLRFGLPETAGRVIFNAVEDREAVVPSAVDVPFPRYVLGLGRVVKKKGFDLLIEAWSAIAKEFPDVGLILAGDGPEINQLRGLAERQGVGSRVSILGPVRRPEVAWLMEHAELFVLPSRVEPFGMVILEALRAGRPVIASSRGGASEIVENGREGMIVDPFDSAALGGAIAQLLGDAELCARLGRAASDRAGAFAWDRIAGEYRALYEDILAGC